MNSLLSSGQQMRVYSKEQKFHIAKEHLRIKKGSHCHRRPSQMGMHTIAQLMMIRRSLSYRLQGFNIPFYDIQFEAMERRGVQITRVQVIQILRGFPLLLSEDDINIACTHILKNEESMRTDHMCMKLRELVEEGEMVRDEGQLQTLINRIKHRLEGKLQNVLQQMRACEMEPNVVAEKSFVGILTSNKFREEEIQLMLAQCCTFSKSIDHLAYLQYFSIFENQQDKTML